MARWVCNIATGIVRSTIQNCIKSRGNMILFAAMDFSELNNVMGVFSSDSSRIYRSISIDQKKVGYTLALASYVTNLIIDPLATRNSS